MNKVILTRGLPASGKTTWAKQYQKENPNTVLVSKDEIRSMLHGGVWSKGREDFVLKVRDFIIKESVENGHDVIVHDTNLHSKHKNRVWKLVADKATVGYKDFTDVSVSECVKRDKGRANSVGSMVIRDMYNRYLKPETPEERPELQDIVICDLDGTLAIHNDRSPYDVDKCDTDSVNQMVYEYLKNIHQMGMLLIIVSGRESKFRRKTCDWLFNNTTLVPLKILMRPTDDKRPDNVVKREIYENEIKGKYNVKLVLDDRNRVVDMWREQGLTVWQVNEGDF